MYESGLLFGDMNVREKAYEAGIDMKTVKKDEDMYGYEGTTKDRIVNISLLSMISIAITFVLQFLLIFLTILIYRDRRKPNQSMQRNANAPAD